MVYASERKPRKNETISEGSEIFAESIQNKDFETASQAVYWTALKVGNAQGIMKAMKNANDFFKRKELRNGL